MLSEVTILIEHGEDTDELESFLSNLAEDNRYAYSDLSFIDWSVKVDRPRTAPESLEVSLYQDDHETVYRCGPNRCGYNGKGHCSNCGYDKDGN